jgi:hypothetical protein
VVVEVFVVQRNPQHPLRRQLAYAVLDALSIPVIDKLTGPVREKRDALLRLAKQQRHASEKTAFFVPVVSDAGRPRARAGRHT